MFFDRSRLYERKEELVGNPTQAFKKLLGNSSGDERPRLPTSQLGNEGARQTLTTPSLAAAAHRTITSPLLHEKAESMRKAFSNPEAVIHICSLQHPALKGPHASTHHLGHACQRGRDHQRIILVPRHRLGLTPCLCLPAPRRHPSHAYPYGIALEQLEPPKKFETAYTHAFLFSWRSHKNLFGIGRLANLFAYEPNLYGLPAYHIIDRVSGRGAGSRSVFVLVHSVSPACQPVQDGLRSRKCRAAVNMARASAQLA